MLKNIANAGKFLTDRTILEYAKDIWKRERFEVPKTILNKRYI